MMACAKTHFWGNDNLMVYLVNWLMKTSPYCYKITNNDGFKATLPLLVPVFIFNFGTLNSKAQNSNLNLICKYKDNCNNH